MRMPPGRLPREVFLARPTGRRPRGRPRTRWRDYICSLAGDSPIRVSRRDWGKESVGLAADAAVPATWLRISGWWWMDGCLQQLRSNSITLFVFSATWWMEFPYFLSFCFVFVLHQPHNGWWRTIFNFQKTVCVQHTRTYKLTRTHTRSLKRNEDKGLWRHK